MEHSKERLFIALVFLAVLLVVGFDLMTDSNQGVSWWHLWAEGAAAAFAGLGFVIVLQNLIRSRAQFREEQKNFNEFRVQAEKWRSDSRKYVQGLSVAIDEQLQAWRLTLAEKEVTFLLLKGLSHKEIAEIRETSEKTVRAQAISIYSKSGLGGRSELAAFFLEDLLVPQTPELVETSQS